MLGNLKTALHSPYHSFRPEYAQHYLAEIEYRFNRPYSFPNPVPASIGWRWEPRPLPDKFSKLGLSLMVMRINFENLLGTNQLSRYPFLDYVAIHIG